MQEGRWRRLAQLAAPVPADGAAEEQPVLGPGHGDIEQTALLGLGGGVAPATPAQRHQAVLQPDDKDHRELQALGGVHGQQRDAGGACVVEIGLGRQGGLLAQPGLVVRGGEGRQPSPRLGGS